MTGTKVRCWTIVGESNVGKSPTIRALLARPYGGLPKICPILLRGGGSLDLHAKVMALQEHGWLPTKAVSEVGKWTASAASKSPTILPAYLNVLFALRFDQFQNTKIKGAPMCPPAEDYLSHFVSVGWELQPMVLMSPAPGKAFFSRFGAPILSIADSKNPGSTNGAVRNHFGWG